MKKLSIVLDGEILNFYKSADIVHEQIQKSLARGSKFTPPIKLKDSNETVTINLNKLAFMKYRNEEN